MDAFLDQLIAGESENGEAFWKDGFSGVGAGPEVHKLLRTNGQVLHSAAADPCPFLCDLGSAPAAALVRCWAPLLKACP